MACFHPLKGFKPRGGTGRPVFGRKGGGDVTQPITVPCGQCIGCRIDRSQQWATRITQEAQFHTRKVFLTLTYSPENVPEGNSLSLADLQKFLKRLRKKHTGTLIRYFACGEYGDTTLRPHYHLILFGYDFPDKRSHSKTPRGDQLWISDELDEIWKLGQCWIGSVSWTSAAYVARYVIKKVNGERASDHYRTVNTETGETYERKPEFIVMSRRPGIGSEFFANFKGDLYPSDFAVIQGKRKKVPGYYDKQLEKENPVLLESVKSRRSTDALKRWQDNTDARLKVREEVLRSKLSTLKRKL